MKCTTLLTTQPESLFVRRDVESTNVVNAFMFVSFEQAELQPVSKHVNADGTIKREPSLYNELHNILFNTWQLCVYYLNWYYYT